MRSSFRFTMQHDGAACFACSMLLPVWTAINVASWFVNPTTPILSTLSSTCPFSINLFKYASHLRKPLTSLKVTSILPLAVLFRQCTVFTMYYQTCTVPSGTTVLLWRHSWTLLSRFARIFANLHIFGRSLSEDPTSKKFGHIYYLLAPVLDPNYGLVWLEDDHPGDEETKCI